MSASENFEGTSALLIADGKPITPAIAHQAAEWLTRLMSGEMTDQDRQSWQQWRDAHPDHDRAWRHIETVIGRLKTMHSGAAYQALSPYSNSNAPQSLSRRKALQLLVWGGVACTTGLLGSRTQVWQEMSADYHTSTGDQRTVQLDDGTSITLNTASAINVRFDARQRRVRLVAGEIMVVTGHALIHGTPDSRPFIIESAEGDIRALGTRFTVRQLKDRTNVAVLESAVEITLAESNRAPSILHAGNSASFTRTAIESFADIDQQASAWTRGQIVADNMRLGDFMADLNRYRVGILRCDPVIADLRFSGVFPLQDTDRILAMLPNVLPVQIRLRTRYWVTVEPRSAT